MKHLAFEPDFVQEGQTQGLTFTSISISFLDKKPKARRLVLTIMPKPFRNIERIEPHNNANAMKKL